eukprot:Gregarina_sp_Poly_1__4125@NODE_225_length_11206_cov_83_083760_g199_i0_p2_GENE_NODE_225_length_11206_cov_83_083760_g199_i0NODE_225_length_11206_cov_83_083760_g199_i0_p2_ORF_typecomplete_len736_score126_11Ank_2/PF12796_7/1_9e08Ank_2/PF12796_7/6_2e14Ank_2/PF12796_7/4_7e12Ank_2/PF12796_7/6_2e07Ank_5/PF13857_6/3e05Ank_5/PF13857_6/0_0046Ank_5/PF13857_6/4_1e09Ank_4/PF13637_6/2_8e06Ank_4/PF13637_6/7_8e11Ank_4/PF13637_6/0_00047Ank_3/PF13606_6/2_9e03Ank_3/PF13606_6/0_00024Ank_3/PF13606_6/0_00038Ank_3/PF13
MDPADSDDQTTYPVNLAELPLEEAKLAIETAEDPTLCCAGGRNCLFYVVQRTHEREALELVEFILSTVEQLDTTSQDDFGQTPLFYAAREGHTSCLELLVEKCKLNPSHVDNATQTPLFYAARDGRISTVIWLVEVGGSDINHLDGNGETPLFYAARDGREETILKMIELGADLSVKNKNKQFPAGIARKSGHRRLATELDAIRKQREAGQSGSSSTRKSAAESKRRPARKTPVANAASPPATRCTRRKRPLRGAEDTSPAAKRRGRGSRSTSGTPDEDSGGEEDASVIEDERNVSTNRSTAKSALTRESPVTALKPVSRESTPPPAVLEGIVQLKKEVGPTANGRRGGKGSLAGVQPETHSSALLSTAAVVDSHSMSSETRDGPDISKSSDRQIYQLQYLAPGKCWTFATPPKLEEFAALFPTIAAWDKNAELPEIGLANDPYRAKWHEQANELMQFLRSLEGAWVFDEPVDPVKWGISDYFEIVTKPMDFCTIRQRLTKGSHYRTVKSFIDDLDQVFYNCIYYNGGESEIGQLCSRIRGLYLNQSRRLGLLDLLEAEERREVISKQIVANAISKRTSQSVVLGQDANKSPQTDDQLSTEAGVSHSAPTVLPSPVTTDIGVEDQGPKISILEQNDPAVSVSNPTAENAAKIAATPDTKPPVEETESPPLPMEDSPPPAADPSPTEAPANCPSEEATPNEDPSQTKEPIPLESVSPSTTAESLAENTSPIIETTP